MTSWVLSIDADYPQHWTIAKEHGFWDLSDYRAIAPGDFVYFWQGEGSFVAQARATSAAARLTPEMTSSWEDSGVRTYKYRFEFVVLDEEPDSQPKWGEVKARLSKKGSPNVKPRYTSSSDEAVLASFFSEPEEPLSPLEVVAQAMLEEAGVASAGVDTDRLTDDEKKVVLTFQAVREGQQKFRKDLIAAYGACAVTGTTIEAALDAAHIRPYSGPKANFVQNGMLLRGDLHRLFDKLLFTVTPDHMVHLSPALQVSAYADLHGKPLATLPQTIQQRPDPGLLQEHNRKCDWLSG